MLSFNLLPALNEIGVGMHFLARIEDPLTLSHLCACPKGNALRCLSLSLTHIYTVIDTQASARAHTHTGTYLHMYVHGHACTHTHLHPFLALPRYGAWFVPPENWKNVYHGEGPDPEEVARLAQKAGVLGGSLFCVVYIEERLQGRVHLA